MTFLVCIKEALSVMATPTLQTGQGYNFISFISTCVVVFLSHVKVRRASKAHPVENINNHRINNRPLVEIFQSGLSDAANYIDR